MKKGKNWMHSRPQPHEPRSEISLDGISNLLHILHKKVYAPVTVGDIRCNSNDLFLD